MFRREKLLKVRRTKKGKQRFIHIMAVCLNKVYGSFCRKKALTRDEEFTKLNKCLKTFDLVAIGVSSTLGSGIYILTGEVSKTLTGPAVVVSFFIAAFASALSGICYAEFATRIPKAGSAYVYTYISIGEFLAFFTGWNLILEYVIGASVVARAFSAYLDKLAGGAINNATRSMIGSINVHGIAPDLDFISFALIMVFTILLATGVKNSSILNNLLTVLNLLVAIVVVISGLFYVNGSNWNDFAPFGVHGIVAGASTCFFAFIGFDIIATTAEETKDPGKSIPKSILGTVSICFLVYFTMSCVITLMVPYYKLSAETAVSDAFVQVNASWISYCVSIGAGISMLGCTLVSLYALPRLLYAMSQDGLLPACFSRISSKANTPVIATVFSGFFSGFLAMAINLHDLVEMLSVGTLMAYSMVNLCVLKLRYDLDLSMDSGSTGNQQRDKADSKTDEEDETIPYEKQRNIGPVPGRSQSQELLVIVCLVFLTIDAYSLAAVLVFGQQFTTVTFYILISLFSLIGLGLCCYLSWQPQSKKELVFRAPGVPFLPAVALFVNAYLILELRKLTWIRLGVWILIGMVVYLGYGLRNSVVATQEARNQEEHKPLMGIKLVDKQM